MTHSNVGFRDAILEPLPGGGFYLVDASTKQQIGRIVFHNRKAARNWARGRGLRLDEPVLGNPPSFPGPNR